MPSTDLRPLRLGQLLDRTFTLYRHNFWLFVGIMAIPSAFSIPFNIEFLSMRSSAVVGRPTPIAVGGTFLFAFAFFGLFWILYSLAIGATTYAVSDAYLGRQATVRESYRKVRTKFWRIVGLVLNVALRMIGVLVVGSIAVGIVIALSAAAVRGQAGGSIARIIFASILVLAYLGLMALFAAWSLRYAVSISALLLEDLGVLAAVRRSIQLTRGRKWQIFVAVLLSLIVGYAGVLVFQAPFLIAMSLSKQGGYLPKWELFASSSIGALGGAITMPLLMIALVLCYYDSRVRKEAFDLQFMMSSLDPRVPSRGTVSPV